MKCTMETLRVIKNDQDDSSYEVGEDRDGLGCIEIRYIEAGRVEERMTFAPESALAIANALCLIVGDMKNAKS